MKILLPIIVIMLIFTANGFLIVNTINNFGSKAVNADEFSPLDFLSDCSEFSVSVGVSKEHGRFASYHYTFND